MGLRSREIAAAEDVSERYVAQLLPLAFLRPELIEGCLSGSVDLAVTGANIAKGVALPQDWREHAAQAVQGRRRELG